MKRIQLMKRAIAIGIGIVAMGFYETVPSFAGPVPTSIAAVKAAAPDLIDQVRTRRSRAVRPAIAIGVIGAVAGVIAAQNQRYYDPGYYGPGYYDPGYGPGYYGPGYYGPGYYRPEYDPGPAIALGVIGAVAGAIVGAPHVAPGLRPRRGQCWVITDKDKNYGYWDRCR